MGRPLRADEANARYHLLNRGNRREALFHKTVDFEAFERMMVEAIERSRIRLFAYCLLPDHSITGTWCPLATRLGLRETVFDVSA